MNIKSAKEVKEQIKQNEKELYDKIARGFEYLNNKIEEKLIKYKIVYLVTDRDTTNYINLNYVFDVDMKPVLYNLYAIHKYGAGHCTVEDLDYVQKIIYDEFYDMHDVYLINGYSFTFYNYVIEVKL